MLLFPFLAKCTDRKDLPQLHPTSGSPENWFAEKILARHNYLSLSFDFFVNWSENPSVITPVIWIKKVLDPAYDYTDIIDNLSDILSYHFGTVYLDLLDSFRKRYSLAVQIIICRDDIQWGDDSEIFIVTFLGKTRQGMTYKSDCLKIRDFKKIIQKHSGGPVQIGAKGLMYGTTNLECYLSKTTSLYPGDVDLILFNQNHDPLALIEYKKHTLTSSISCQQLSNYYPRPDGRKYNRLSMLRDFLSGNNYKLPIINIYYPTNPSCRQGRMELLKGSTGDLQTDILSNFPLPLNESEYEGVIKKLTKAICYHQSIR